ncbi:MAG: hypothetical protein H5T69_00350 [Chloroflexi bacterium]|nr:hypothetical protein [Chloroflexota bacterium]
MKKLWAILLVLASIPFFTLGILFLIAAIGAPSRALVGLALIGIGLILLITGVRWLRRLAAVAPDVLKTEAVNLAQRLGGELTVAQLRAEYRISQELAQRILDELVRENAARVERREERTVYVFAGLRPSMVEKVCPYCGTELPVRSNLRKCPNCGAQLELTKT